MVDDTRQSEARSSYNADTSESALYKTINEMNAVELLYWCLRDRQNKAFGGYSAAARLLERPEIFIPAIRTLMLRVHKYVAKEGEPFLDLNIGGRNDQRNDQRV